MTENNVPGVEELPEYTPTVSQDPVTESPTVVSTEPEAITEAKAAAVVETTVTETDKGAGDPRDAAFTLGNYKNLAKATAFNIEGEERHLYGRANYSYTPYKPRKEEEATRIPLAIPSMSMAGLASSVEAILSLNYEKDAQARDWAALMDQANGLNPVQDAFIKGMNREGSDWKQIPKFGDKMLVGALARRPGVENSELKDSQALLYALSALGLGAPFQAPMWHSGFWVSFRPASEEAWVNFNERLTADKIRIGRNASGLAFSNVNAIFTERSLEFALEHVIDHNIRLEAGSTRRDLFKKLRAPDIPIFLWAFLVANYPSGYPISRGCSAVVGNCTNVIHDTINLRILQVTDDSCFEEKHRSHMAKNYPGGVTEKEVEEYQSSLLALQAREFTILQEGEMEARVTLKVPSAEEYMTSGRRWFDGIVEMVNSILAKDTTDNQREKVYQQYAKSGVLREYSHWIDQLHMNSNRMTDVATLENVLKEITPHGQLRDTLYKKIADFIESSTLSVIAVPNYACPSCGKLQAEHKEGDRFTDCIPLDVSQAFFNLALLRVVEITRR